jgi:hypothetical protein
MSQQSAPKPVYETPEQIAERKRALAEMEKRDLQLEVTTLRADLHRERHQEKERQKRRESELTVQKRLAAEARAEREKMREAFEARLAEAARTHARERSEDAARIAHFHAEAAAAREEADTLRAVLEGARAEVTRLAGADVAAAFAKSVAAAVRGAAGGGSGGDDDISAASSSSAVGTTRSVERDTHGNFVVVERDARGRATVSAERVASEAHTTPPSTYGPSLPAPPPTASMSAALRSLLIRLGIEQLVPNFEEEELTDVPLLKSMGPMFEQNMREIGLDAQMMARLRAAIF